MFKIAILIGTYSYIIFFLGVFGLLHKQIILAFSITYLIVSVFYLVKTKTIIFKLVKLSLDKTFIFLFFLIFLQAIVNLVGALGPEISFDALWYHLTLPKIYLNHASIFHIPGSLLYYSDMPKLIEMLYITSLSLTGNEIFAKLVHYLFGLFVLYVIYKLSVKYNSKKFALLAALVFYSNLVVGWESISAYVDLARTFFEIMTMWGFINWIEKNEKKWLILSSLMLGLAISTKLISIISLPIYLTLITYLLWKRKEGLGKIFLTLFQYALISVLIVSPWLIFSYINTGNPIYPYFSLKVDSGYLISLPHTLNLIIFNDPISPIYLITVPLILIFFKRFKGTIKIISIFALLNFLIWFFTQEDRGTRFLLPYLSIFSVPVVYTINVIKHEFTKKALIALIILISLTSTSYRLMANVKFIPYLLGRETKIEFLAKHLNFDFGDFADIDGYFKTNIDKEDMVLLYGFHNLYYVNFPFIDSSYVKKGDKFNYVAVQNTPLPKRSNNLKPVYYNAKTHVKLYTLGRKSWEY